MDGLQILAKATGGVAWLGTKPEVAFEQLRADLQNYYSLGYQAKTGGDAERSIEVKPKRADLRVRTKKSIVFRTAEAEMSGRVTSNLQTAQVNDLGISLQVGGDVTTEGDKRRVPVDVQIPARNLTVASEGDVLTGGFSVYSGTSGATAKASDVTRRTHEIRWTPDTVKQLGKNGSITFSTKVFLEKRAGPDFRRRSRSPLSGHRFLEAHAVMFTEGMAMPKNLPLALAILLAQPLMAQTPLKEVIDVRVTNVEVIATDAKGNHVPGLTRDDFELYENGKLQPITNLFEASAGAAGASSDGAPKTTLPRRIVIYLDDSSLLPNNRKQLIPALKNLVTNTMTPADQMMIATFH